MVNLYAGNEAVVELKNNKVKVSQTTQYPWNGKVLMKVDPEKEGNFTLKLRIPSWARNQVLPGDLYSYLERVGNLSWIEYDGKKIFTEGDQKYFIITKNWKKGDQVSIEFPMQVRKVAANEKVEEDRGKVALEYGPLVYAVEEIDNQQHFDAILVADSDQFEVKKEETLLGGVIVIENEKLKAIPYYAWSNRGIGKMKVWLPYVKE